MGNGQGNILEKIFHSDGGYLRRNHFVNKDNKNYTYYETPPKPKKHGGLLVPLLFFSISVLWMEFWVKISAGLSVAGGAAFTALFSALIACFLTLLSTLFKNEKANRIIACALTAVFSVWYSAQAVYNNVFGTFFVINSIYKGGAGQALNSSDMIFTAIKSRFIFVLLMFFPFIFCVVFGKRLSMFGKTKLSVKGILLGAAVAFQALGVLAVGADKASSDVKSSYNLYYGELQQNAVCEKFGLFTMQRLDISRMIFGYKSDIRKVETTQKPQTTPDEVKKKSEPQIIKTDFEKLSAETDNKDLKLLYDYFAGESPSFTNEYTGVFKDYNVIFITAESFSQYAIDKNLTPSLYKLYSEGFQFENYYSPAWGVSTTDGEYANLTGLVPKSGVWSFSQSAEKNVSFPFTLGEQCRAKGYEQVRAYHNHTYDYYDRDKYLTNIGYDYKAIGKGLDLGEDVWPNSDLKMMQKTVDDYINAESFSVYYMTVSGHGGYSYNTVSERNAEFVKNLKYSDEVKGYFAANIELDRAVEYLLGRLEDAGKLDNTLICLTTDHYPYSLEEFKGLDELAGHKVDPIFERYKNSWLMWSGSMKNPVSVSANCSSIDILPTMLNMLGFDYDSRTLAGTDVFGSKEPFVVFADRSWISQNGKYNANSGKYTSFKNAAGRDDADALNNRCTNMFTVSRMILDSNVYAELYGGEHIKGK